VTLPPKGAAPAGGGANADAATGTATGTSTGTAPPDDTTLAPPRDPRRALVLFSGGQDSTVCLAWALDRFAHVETVGFDYGQRHRIELDCRAVVRREMSRIAPRWAARLGDDHLLGLSVLASLSDSALLGERAIEMQASGLPNTFVPGRNLMFLVAAAALAYRRGASVLVGGMCETDYSGYPDCRDATMRAMQQAITLGMDTPFEIATPLMTVDKAGTWALARELGGAALVDTIVEHTHTCYLGDRGARHAWGYGCGACPACVLRARGFERDRGRAA
jgi:7-cyano-7-deazaguanine synthase